MGHLIERLSELTGMPIKLHLNYAGGYDKIKRIAQAFSAGMVGFRKPPLQELG